MAPHLHVNLTVEFKADVCWWFDNIERFNGQRPMVKEDDTCEIFVDATGHGGLGVFVDGAFIAWSPKEARRLVLEASHPETEWANEWECYNVAVMLELFGWYLSGRSVVVWCDNQCTVAALRKFAIGKSSATKMAAIVRCIFSLCLKYNVCLRPRWIEGDLNVLADKRSRQEWPIAADKLQE